MKTLKDVKLNEEDKRGVRDNILSFMKSFSIKNRYFARFWEARTTSFFNLKSNFQFAPMRIISAAIVIVFLFGGGTAVFAAESSTPGDSLYHIKTAGESVRGWMKISPESRANWQAQMIDRRLAELDKLLADGKITDEQKIEMEKKIENHIDLAKEHFDKMKESGQSDVALGIASRMENVLRIHEGAFKKMDENFNGQPENMVQKRNEMEDKLKNDNSEGMKSSAEGKSQAAENKIAEVEKFINNQKDKIDEEQFNKAMEELQKAKDALTDGKNKLEAGNYGEAFVAFSEAHRSAQFSQMLANGKPQMLMPMPMPEGALKPQGKFKRAMNFFRDKGNNGNVEGADSAE